ncbi:MAG TPA: hypothetical protein VMC79_02460 [Rectinemataceae bacterium]|nr:hypothetical protein [Rectinemataceae bacterium]
MLITFIKTGRDGRTQFYTIHDRQAALDAPFALCAAWRVGSGRERERLHRFQSVGERDRMLRELIARRFKAGYKLLYSFSRAGFAGQTDIALEQAFGARGGAFGDARGDASAEIPGGGPGGAGLPTPRRKSDRGASGSGFRGEEPLDALGS